MRYILKNVLCIACLSTTIFTANAEERIDVRALVRYQLDSIDNIYIPTDIYDAFGQIDGFLSDSAKQETIEMSEREFAAGMHFGLGIWMRNNWGLWNGSRLSKYFNDCGIFHADDMSGIILDSYHRYLRNDDIDIEGQIDYYKDYYKNLETKVGRKILKNRKAMLRSVKKNMRPYRRGRILYFDYPYGFTTEQEEDNYDDGICAASGKIIDVDFRKELIKVRLIQSCSPNGVIIYDTHYGEILYKDEVYDHNGSIIPQDGRRVFYMKEGDEYWFRYSADYWETDD